MSDVLASVLIYVRCVHELLCVTAVARARLLPLYFYFFDTVNKTDNRRRRIFHFSPYGEARNVRPK